VTIDLAADGHGWFVDPTPSDNFDFAHAIGPTSLATDPTTDAAGHIDLLSTVMHEMGEQLGLPDQFAPAAQDELIYAFLADGQRQLPSGENVAEANAATVAAAQSAGGDTFVFAPHAIATAEATHPGSAGGPAVRLDVAHDSFTIATMSAEPLLRVADMSAFDGPDCQPHWAAMADRADHDMGVDGPSAAGDVAQHPALHSGTLHDHNFILA
jgi:hypothetical protein